MKATETLGHLKNLIRALPDSPGVYQFFDSEGTLHYVGKAKNLKKRVSSYFTKESGLSGKTVVMIRKTTDLRTIVVNSEYDALLLENSLIKEFQPKYNILLRDDKTYPWICIRNEHFPRIHPTRTRTEDGSQYFGPYASVRNMNNLLELVRQTYPLRSCKHPLTPAGIREKRYRVCLEFSIGNCLGPCEGRQSAAEYEQMVREIREIIRGNISQVTRHLRQQMQTHALNYEFEKAQQAKEKLMLLEKYQSKSAVVSASLNNIDVFSLLEDKQSVHVNFMKVAHGCVIQSLTTEVKRKLDEPAGDILLLVIAEMRERGLSESPELILPLETDLEIPGVTITVPLRGDKKKLLELSLRNAFYYRAEKEKQKELADPERHTHRILERMKKDLRLTEWPEYIECFDNSNTQGEQPVSALVVFRKTRPSKREYRHYNIRTVTGPDDYASMEEVIRRRYRRLIDEGAPLPHLIIVDGGKGQLSAARKTLGELGIYGKVGLIGIAKKLEEIYYPGDPLPLYLDKKSETLRVIQHIRDEAHRFGITHHRKRREKNTIRTGLTDIPGVGEATAQELLRHFRSVKQIRDAGPEELATVVGKSKAGLVFRHFHPGEE